MPGAALAIATDFNPGTSPVCSMPEAIAMACTLYGLDTARGADRGHREPRLGPGSATTASARSSPASAPTSCCWTTPRSRSVPYRPGHDPVVATFIGGELAWDSH